MFIERRERSERTTDDTNGPDRHSMNTTEAVASGVAAPAASETAASAAGQESVGVGSAGPDGLPVVKRGGSAAARVQLGKLPNKNVESRRGFIPPAESRGGRIPYKIKR